MRGLSDDLRAGLDPVRLLTLCKFDPYEWQIDVLRERERWALLCCCRQAGKSTTAAAAAVHQALYTRASLILILAPGQDQSSELLAKARSLLAVLVGPAGFAGDSLTALKLRNGSRIISLPANEDTIRGYSSVNLLIFDEAARVSDRIWDTARPMIAVSRGRVLALSTPNGQSGWFYREYVDEEEDWLRIEIPADKCPLLDPAFLARERKRMRAEVYASEYGCQFVDAVASVFYGSDIEHALDPQLTPLFSGGW